MEMMLNIVYHQVRYDPSEGYDIGGGQSSNRGGGNSSDRGGNSSVGPYGCVGHEWAVISRKWLDMWRLAVCKDRRPPATAAIDNYGLLCRGGGGRLREGVELGGEAEAVPPPVFRALQSWYGGGPVIVRRVGRDGELELHPIRLRVEMWRRGGEDRSVERSVDRSLPLTELVERGEGEGEGEVRMWNKKLRSLLDMTASVGTSGLQDGQAVVVQTRNTDGTWSDPFAAAAHRGLGLVGLDNLGNTCYLNSSLQALLHTDLLVDYFLSKR